MQEEKMKIGKKALKMSSGEIRHFKSEAKRDRFEDVAKAYSHGWKGPKKGKDKSHHSPAMPL
jgi:hypothetical protein